MQRTTLGARLLLCLIGVISVLAVPTFTQQRGGGRDVVEMVNGREAVAREVLVRFRDGAQPAALAELGSQIDATSIRRVGRAGALRLRSRSMTAAALAALLSQRADVLYAEPNYIVRAFTTDPGFPDQWALQNSGQSPNGGLPGTPGSDIGAVPAWEVSVGSNTRVVAVIDTGIDYNHPDLAANMWSAPAPFTVDLGNGVVVTCEAGTHGFNAITDSCDPMDDHSHGTHVAGTIGAVGNNGVGIAGVNWTAQLMGVKFLDDTGAGNTADAVQAIRFVIEARRALQGGADVRVLSASWGGTGFSQALLDEINAAQGEEMLLVAAAGNSSLDNDLTPTYPASFNAPNIVAVAATTNTDEHAWFSNYGATSVHLSAPGVDILSTIPGDGYAFYSGTSMATPHVSGAAALVLSRCAYDTAQLKDALLRTVRPVGGLASVTVTGGSLNVNSAIRTCVALPDAPTLSATGGDGQVALSWSSVVGATGYAVRRSLAPGGPYTEIATDTHGVQHTDSDVVNGTTYYYVVAAANAVGSGPDSNEASATPNPLPDLVVSSLTAPNDTGAGSTITVVVTTTNQDTGAAGESTMRLYLSADSVFSTDDVPLEPAHEVPALPPGGSSSASLSVTLPPNAPLGASYVLAVADADHEVWESQEGNNSQARWITIGPDLAVTAFGAPLVAAAGESILVSDTVRNQGGGASTASMTSFYLSLDYALDATDTPLGPARSVPALGAGASSSGAVTVALPASLAAGQWYLIAKADGGSVVPEAYEGNNTSVRQIKIGADLLVLTLSAPVKGGAGLSILATDTTLNQGTGSTVPAVTRFYLSVDTQRDAGDSELGARVVPPLAAGASSSATTTLTIPLGTATGAYHLLAVADADDALPETLETNNLHARTIQIGADLSVASVTAPASAGAGASIVVGDTTTNQGGGTVGATTTRYFFSTDGLLDAQDVVLGARAVPALTAGASHSGSATVTIPAGASHGTYYIIARADANEAEAEAAESNNNLSRAILLGGDLTLSSLSVPSKSGAGLTMVVSDTTRNAGATSVPPSVTRFYLSVNAIHDAADTPLQGSRAVPALAPGASSSGSATLTVPATVGVGYFYVIAKADADDAAAETQESNNALARLVAFGPDLAVTALTPPAKAAAGSTISVSATTRNEGGGTSAASVTTFALSADSTLTGSDIALAGSHTVDALAPGATGSAVTTLTIPENVTPGSYFLFAKADATGVVAETTETNNTRWFIVGIGPDLAVSAASLSSGVVPIGATVTANDTALNQGAGLAAASTLRYYLSSNSWLDPSDVPLPATRAIPPLAPNESSAGSTAITIPPGTPPGTYYLLAVADSGAAVAESDEGNNARFVRAIQVTAP